ncbi:unnamed protein product, partial [Chrysoparadoxa australica]
PAKIVGVRNLDVVENTAMIDVEIKWAGNPVFVLEIGRKGLPLVITLKQVRFSGKLRVELSPLVPIIPIFGALALTFMEKPFIDFTFKLGALDVMSLGAGDYSIGNTVSNIIKDVMQGLMTFPKKLVIPMLEDQDIEALTNPSPTGVVQITIVGCNDLRAADINGKSDPYCKFYINDEKQKTKVINGTLNPRWEETFDVLSYDASVQVIKFEVFDHDIGGGNDSLGTVDFPLSLV